MGAKRTTITVHRSEEVLPSDVGRHLVRQSTSVSSEGEGGAGGATTPGNADPLEGAETERLDSRVEIIFANPLVNGGIIKQ
jgi:hypothetical protein